MAKYNDWSFGQAEALINIIGEGNALALLNGDKTVVVEEKAVRIKDAVRPLFDRRGRRIPPRGLAAAVCDPDRNFRLVQPDIDYGLRLARFEGTGLASSISAADFQTRARGLFLALGQSEQLKNLLKATYLPVVIPRTLIEDLGRTTEEFVEAAGKSYCRQFPERSFKNYRQGELEGRVTIVDGGRYERLVDGMAKSVVVGIYFPSPLQGFSVDAQREQMAELPEGFVLSGPLDTAMGWVMYPDVLSRDFKTPGYDCAAVQWQSSGRLLSFRTDDGGADFDYRGFLAGALDSYSGGLLFLG